MQHSPGFSVKEVRLSLLKRDRFLFGTLRLIRDTAQGTLMRNICQAVKMQKCSAEEEKKARGKSNIENDLI